MEGLTNTAILWRGGGAGGSVISGYPPAKCTNLVAKAKNASVALTWNDPEDITVSGSITIKWAKTVVVRKVGSYPTSEEDGVVVVSSTIRNQYASNPYVDSGLTNHTKYYYAAFSCSEDGVYNREMVTATATPIPYKTMTVRIDLNNSNPANCGSYADAAVGMTAGKNVPAWDEFFGYKPCLFKDGRVVGYLNPNDYGKFADGRTADITSGNAGDVMVEFPRRGLKISKSGKILTVSMTDDPNNPEFTYYAHTRGSASRDYFYMGAYLGYVNGSKLRSLSGKSPTTDTSLSTFRTYAKNLGTGYMEVAFYQFLFLQCMYLLQYKGNLQSQSAHGYGYCSTGSKSNTGATNTKGMMYGSSSGTDHVKLFGIEDFWGNLYWLMDGYYVDGSYNILTTTDNFNDNGSGYKNNGRVGLTSNSGGYYSDVIGTSETGLTPKAFNGSTSTYFCDYGSFGSYGVPYVGGRWDDSAYAGAFQFCVYWSPGSSDGYMGGRLGYL